MDNFQISVIVATYNDAIGLEKSLNSVAGQTHAEYVELIIIDGGSSDETLDVINRHANIISKWVSEPDNGVADAYNKGVREASGKWVYFLNAGDIFYKSSSLEEIIPKLPDSYDVCSCVVMALDGKRFEGRFSWRLLAKNVVHHQGLVYKLEYLRRYPYNDQYKRYGHDHEHNMFIWKRRDPVYYLDLVIAVWSYGGISDRANWQDYKQEFLIRKNTLGIFAIPLNIFTVLRFFLKSLKRRFG